MRPDDLLAREEKNILAEILNEKVADLSKEYDARILSIQKKLKLFPRKERWVLDGIMYVTEWENENATMKWHGPIVGCNENVPRPYADTPEQCAMLAERAVKEVLELVKKKREGKK